jgi:uncharacterized protein YmfQ (DUF2313 family)
MARSVDDYRDLLLMLLPVGDAWSRDVDSDIAKLFKGVAEEFVRIDGHAELLLKESVPSGVTALIEEYEKDWDLPGKCIAPGTVNERRNVLVNKVIGIRDQSRQTYIDRAARLGVAITITEYAPGDSVPGHAEIPTPDACYVIQVNAALTNQVFRVSGSATGEAYSTWGNAQMECALREILQAHKILIFSYS